MSHAFEAALRRRVHAPHRLSPVWMLSLGLLALAIPTMAQAPAGYYNSVDTSNPSALRSTLHDVIDDHTRFPYTSSSTDTWDILNLADEDPNNTGNIVDIYKNASYAKISGGIGAYNREHSWPKSYGFPDDGSSNYPYTDCHHLFVSDVGYNADRSNKPFRNCDSSCAESTTDFTDGRGGGSGVYPGNSNWTSGSFTQGTWETWGGRKGDVARAILYMDIRYEGGNHGVTGVAEPDLIATNSESLIDSSNTGNNESVAYMGMLDVLLAWHAADPVDSREIWRNEVVFTYQGNRNPFIDHPEWVDCLYSGICGGGGGDTTPPSNPSGLVANGGTGSVGLTWNANGESDLAGYHVYRATSSGGPYSRVNGSLLSVNNFTDSSVSGGTTYYYVVRAVDTSNNESSNSNQSSATPSGGGGGGGSLILTEVFYDGAGGDDGQEWVEIYNGGSSAVNLSGYSLGSGGTSYTYTTAQLSGILQPGQTFVVGGSTSNSGNGSPSYDQVFNFNPDIQNSGSTADGVALFDVPANQINGSTVPIDAVVYGGSNNSNLIDETGAANAPEVGDASSGSSIERTDLAGSWQIQNNPTPGSVPFGGSSNSSPSVSISSPSNGSTFVVGASVSFSGSASDSEDGNLSGSLSWTSSLNGSIGSGASLSTSALSAGTHTITASVTDSGGLSDSAQVSITITVPTNNPPSASISAPSGGASFDAGTSVSFSGSASDSEDGNLSGSLSWSSSLDGSIGSGASFSTGGLSVGSHTITASVTDSGGLSDSAQVSITINPVGGGCNDCIDWNSTTTVSYSNQDASANSTVVDGGDGILLQDNTWRRTTQTFNVTANTVIEVEFESTVQGEIHGIGFDEDDTLSNNTRIFQLHGTQTWGTAYQDYNNYGSGRTTYTIPVGQFYTGSSMYLVVVNDNDAGSGNNSWFRNVRVYEDAPGGGGGCAADVDFESGAAGWFHSAASSCSTGTFTVGTPSQQTSGGVTTQVGGDHTSGSGSAFYTAANSSAGNADVDGGNCIAESPVYSVSDASDVSLWYFHGQRDGGDDATGDFFRLEISTDGGSTYTTLASNDDSVSTAAWQQATTTVPAGSSVKFRLQVSDGSGPGDIIEAGVDDVSICAQ